MLSSAINNHTLAHKYGHFHEGLNLRYTVSCQKFKKASCWVWDLGKEVLLAVMEVVLARIREARQGDHSQSSEPPLKYKESENDQIENSQSSELPLEYGESENEASLPPPYFVSLPSSQSWLP
jgi:hypothetical protein